MSDIHYKNSKLFLYLYFTYVGSIQLCGD